jgi:hypothetical protein
MSLITAGRMNRQVAAEIGVSEVTVKVHRHKVMRKLGVKSLAELVRIADVLEISGEGVAHIWPRSSRSDVSEPERGDN